MFSLQFGPSNTVKRPPTGILRQLLSGGGRCAADVNGQRIVTQDVACYTRIKIGGQCGGAARDAGFGGGGRQRWDGRYIAGGNGEGWCERVSHGGCIGSGRARCGCYGRCVGRCSGIGCCWRPCGCVGWIKRQRHTQQITGGLHLGCGGCYPPRGAIRQHNLIPQSVFTDTRNINPVTCFERHQQGIGGAWAEACRQTTQGDGLRRSRCRRWGMRRCVSRCGRVGGGWRSRWCR